MTEIEALKARLRKTWWGRTGLHDRHNVNPDGPEAADAIERLEAENAKLTKLAKDNNTLARMYKAQADEFRQKYVAALKG